MSPTIENSTQANLVMKRRAAGVQSELIMGKPSAQPAGTSIVGKASVHAVRAESNGLDSSSSDISDRTSSSDIKDRKESNRYISEFFHKEPCLYGHEAFKKASLLYEALCHPPRDDPLALHKYEQTRTSQLPDVEFKNDHEKRLVLNLVFSTLKYQQFLEDMLEDCAFYTQYPEYRDEAGLVMVILCDYRQRKFQLRTPILFEKEDPEIKEIEKAIILAKTKLNAALAKSRIKNNVSSVEKLLPEAVRCQDEYVNNMHVCAWVNQIQSSLNDVLNCLECDGFSSASDNSYLTGTQYYVDRHCSYLVHFASDIRATLEEHHLVTSGNLVIQDKSSCIGPQSVKNLLNEGDDIIIVGSGLSAAHLASLTHTTESSIYVFGFESDLKRLEFTSLLEKLGAKSRVHVIESKFTDVDVNDEQYRHIKIILYMTECSRSAITNPVDFIVSEGEDVDMLKDLSLGQFSSTRLSELNLRHSTVLKHALKFPRVQAVVYGTRSVHKAENESVVTRCVEFTNMVQQKKTPWRVSPPVLPLSISDIENETPLSGKYLIFPADHTTSGCFLAVITREAEDPKEAAKDILARAQAKGLISGASTSNGEKSAKPKRSSKKKDKKVKKKDKSPMRMPPSASPYKSMPAIKVNKTAAASAVKVKPVIKATKVRPFVPETAVPSIPNILRSRADTGESCAETVSSPSSPSVVRKAVATPTVGGGRSTSHVITARQMLMPPGVGHHHNLTLDTSSAPSTSRQSSHNLFPVQFRAGAKRVQKK